MARSEGWDRIYIVMQTVAASCCALLTMLSTPLFCLLPGLVACRYILKKDQAPGRFGKKHTILAVATPVLIFLVLSWLPRNYAAASEYARYGYGYHYGGMVDPAYFAKFIQWINLLKAGFLLTFPFLFVAMAMIVFNHFKSKKISRNNHSVLLVLVILQVLVVLVVFASASHQTGRYLLPLLGYFAILTGWSLWQLNKKWITWTVMALFLIQLILVNLYSFGYLELNREVGVLQGKYGKKHEIMNAIIRMMADASPAEVTLATGELGLFSLQFEYFASKNTDYSENFLMERDRFVSVEFIMVRTGIDCDIEKTWQEIITSRPGYIVVISPYLRRTGLAEYDTNWRNVLEGAAEVSDRVEESPLFRKIETPDYPEIEIYKGNQ
jgi:hypothetical protein